MSKKVRSERRYEIGRKAAAAVDAVAAEENVHGGHAASWALGTVLARMTRKSAGARKSARALLEYLLPRFEDVLGRKHFRALLEEHLDVVDPLTMAAICVIADDDSIDAVLGAVSDLVREEIERRAPGAWAAGAAAVAHAATGSEVDAATAAMRLVVAKSEITEG